MQLCKKRKKKKRAVAVLLRLLPVGGVIFTCDILGTMMTCFFHRTGMLQENSVSSCRMIPLKVEISLMFCHSGVSGCAGK